MQKAYFLFALLLVSPGIAQPKPKRISLESQATTDLDRLINFLKEKVAEKLKTPEEPTKFQKALDLYSDWFLKFKGSKIRRFWKAASWIPIFPGIIAIAIAATNTGREELKLADHLSYAAFSLGLFTVQTYIAKKFGLDHKDDINARDVLSLVSDLIQVEINKQTKKAAALRKLQKNRLKEDSADHTALTQQLKEQTEKVTALQDQLAQLNKKLETKKAFIPSFQML